jgi:Fe2+ or Zn2+ uptake regulation protein
MINSSPKSRLTKQRKLILEVVKLACYHPTAEQIYSLVKKRLPKISVGTVYRNLDVLSEQKLIKRIDIPGEPARFDGHLEKKAYFVCNRTGVIYDLRVKSDELLKLFKSKSFIKDIDEFNILLFGTSKSSSKERSLRKGKLKH